MTAILDDTRPCLRIPIAELFEAARFLDQAADAEVAEDSARAAVLIRETDMKVLNDWIKSLLGEGKS